MLSGVLSLGCFLPVLPAFVDLDPSSFFGGMATSYNARSPLTFSAPQESTSVLYSLSTHSASPLPTLQTTGTHTKETHHHPGSYTPLHSPVQPYSSAYNLNYGHYETLAMDHIGSVQTYLTSPVSSLSSFSSTLTCAYSATTSPQPSLYQVPPFGGNISPINGYTGKMQKYGPYSSALMSPSTTTSASSSPSSFSFSSRNFRSTTCTTTTDSSGRIPFVSRKSSQLSHYTSPRSNNKTDILLDRKAFISLEKSINWEAAFPCSTSPVTPPAQNPSSEKSVFQCALDSANCSQVQSYNRSSPQLLQATSAVQLSDSSKDDSGFSTIDSNVSAGNGEGDFTLPGMKDVPAWLKCKCCYCSSLSILASPCYFLICHKFVVRSHAIHCPSLKSNSSQSAVVSGSPIVLASAAPLRVALAPSSKGIIFCCSTISFD